MKLMILHPDSGFTPEELAVRVARLQTAVGPDVEIAMECVQRTQVCVDSLLDASVAAPEIVTMALDAQSRGFDAVGIYCLSDPGFDACREALAIPVLGGGHCAFLTAASLGYSFSMITTSARRIPQKREFVRGCGVDLSRLASIRSIEYNIEQERGGKNREATIAALAETAKRCADEDGADTVILGCLSFAGMGAEVAQRAGVCVVDPAFSLVSTMEATVRQGLTHSKKAYPFPPSARRSWRDGELNT